MIRMNQTTAGSEACPAKSGITYYMYDLYLRENRPFEQRPATLIPSCFGL